MDRAAQLLVSMLAVMQTGAAYLPIDPTFPTERQEFMFADAEAPVLLTQDRYLGAIDSGTATRDLRRPRLGADRRAPG